METQENSNKSFIPKINEDVLWKALDANPDGIIISSVKDGKIIWINDGFVKGTGYGKDIIGESTLNINIWINIEDRNRLFGLLNEKGAVNNFDTKIRMINGQLADVSMSSVIYTMENGSQNLFTIVKDITKIKKIEEELQSKNEEIVSQNEEYLQLNEELNQANDELTKLIKKLEDSENKLKEAQQIAHLGHWELDIRSNILTWSDEIYRIFELSPKEFLATYESFLEHIHPEDREMVNISYNNSIKNKTPYDITHRIQLSSGAVKYVREQCRTEYDQDGNAIRSLGTVLDVSESKKVELLLKKEAERASLLLELHKKANVLTENELYKYALDSAVKLTESKIGFLHTISKDQKSIVHRTWNDEALKGCSAIYDTHSNIDIAGNWVDCVRLNKPVIYNDFANSPNQKGLPKGHTPIKSFMSIPVMDDDNIKIIFGVGNKINLYDDYDVVSMQLVANELQKIVKHKTVEQAVKEKNEEIEAQNEEYMQINEELNKINTELIRSRAEFQSYFEMGSIGMCVTLQNKKWLIVNDRLSQMLGYSKEELYGLTWEKLTHPEDLDADIKLFNQVLDGKIDKYELDKRFIRKDGVVIYTTLCLSCQRKKDGSINYFLASLLDITEKKIAEAKLLEQKEKELILRNELQLAKNNEEMKSFFIANISHELRTPLTGMLGIIELLQIEKLNKQQKEMVDVLFESSERLKMLINDVLNISKIEAGQISILKNANNLRKFISEIQTLYKHTIQSKGLVFEIVIDETIPLNIMLDANRVQQVLSNLLSNAVKFTDKGEIILNISIANNNLIFKVIDTGIGIDDKNINLFERFTQIDNALSKNYDGLGLGLSIAKGLVELMGGQIGFESRLGYGSTFWFSLPIEEVEESDILIKKNIPTNINLGKKILLVEDQKTIQIVVNMILTGFGCEVDIVNNGEEAINIYEDNKYDIIFMDMRMPILSGEEAMYRIREKGIKVPPIIVLTADAMDVDRQRFLDMGFDDYIAKPINREIIYKVLINH